MDANRVLQPHVCCIGNPVAGNPMQFVMTKASRACGLDWRFFTSQVALNEIEIAIRGVRALGLQGVAILDPFRSQVVPWLDTITETAMRLNQVTMARSDGSSWIGDNNSIAGLWNLLQTYCPLSVPAIPEDSTPSPPHRRLVVTGRSDFCECVAATAPSNWLVHVWEEPHPVSDEHTVDAMVFQTQPSRSMLKTVAEWRWSPDAVCVHTPDEFERIPKAIRNALEPLNIRLIDAIEWRASEYAADFYFLTGVTPPREIVRESLEEYLQW
jgi:hypothetical protein